MNQIVKVLNKQNFLWISLFASATLSMYTPVGMYLLIFFIALNIVWYCREYYKVSDIGIIILIIYLPFYTLLRLLLLKNGVGMLSSSLNYFRDFIILILFFNYVRKNGLKIRKNDILWIFFVGNWLIGLIISIINGYSLIGISGLHLTVVPTLLFFIVQDKGGEIDTQKVFKLFLQMAILVAIVGLICYYTRPSIYQQLFTLAGNEINAADYVRYVSVFFTPNVCGCFLAIGFSIALAYFVDTRNFIYLAPIFLFLFCLTLTLSRGAWMFAFAALVITLFFLKPRMVFPILTLILIIYIGSHAFNWGALLSDNFMIDIIEDRFGSLFQRSNNSSYGRMDYWLEALQYVRKSPLGYGLGVSTTAQISREVSTGILVIDGFYVKSIIETGVLGVVFCISFVYWIIKRSIGNYIKKHNIITMIPVLVSFGFLVQSFGSNTFDFICTAPWMWIFLGLSTKYERYN